MNFPENLLYTKDHEWVLIEGDTATIGITEFAQSELGDIVYVEVETVGDIVEEGKIFGSVEAVKTVSDLYMPLTGEIIEMNSVINTSPSTINADPYGEGWIIKVKPSNSGNTSGLLTAQQYKALIGH